MMTILEAIDARHSVRAYQDKPIDEEIRKQLDAFLADCNQESGLNIFIRYDDRRSPPSPIMTKQMTGFIHNPKILFHPEYNDCMDRHINMGGVFR